MNETDSTVTAFSFFAAEDVAAVKRKGGDGMKRNVDLNEISGGRLYSANDMVKVECGDCARWFCMLSEYGNFGCFRFRWIYGKCNEEQAGRWRNF